MEEYKSPLRRWFEQIVTLEEIRGSELKPVPDIDQPEHNEQPPEEGSWFHFRHYKKYAVAGLALLIVLSAAWLFASLFLTTIKAGDKTLSARVDNQTLGTEISNQAAAYKLTIVHPDKTKKQYKLADMGLTLDKDRSVELIRQQQASLGQRLKWWQTIEVPLSLKKNTEVFDKFIASETSITVQPSKDAVLSIVNGEIKIDDAVAGRQYGLEDPAKTLASVTGNLQASPVKLKIITLNPALSAEVLEPYKDDLEQTIHQSVSFKIGERSITPTVSDVAAWLEITPDAKTKKVDITVNSGKVQEYINKAAAREIRPAKAQIMVRQPDGSARVLVAGVNGVDVLNKEQGATQIADNLLKGEGINVALNVSYEAYKTITTDSYEKWIEVDLTHKRMYAYERDNLVKTQLVTAGAPSTPTVTGQFAIYSKYTRQDMRGNNVDGSRYFQPNVKWISYFYRDYAIHGNYWRPTSYFGNINSSHGCVSVVESEAEWMYNWAPIGTPVIVHT